MQIIKAVTVPDDISKSLNMIAEPSPFLLNALKALTNPTRLNILVWLSSPRDFFPIERSIADPDTVGVCVTHIQERVGLAQSTVSSYMAILEQAGLVQATRVQKWTHYRRNEENITRLAREFHCAIQAQLHLIP